MIPGLSSSSGIATAVRTASKARATMDDMSRQIATGQKVSSVKDNGAAWARASALKAHAKTTEVRETVVSQLKANLDYSALNIEVAFDQLERLNQLQIMARSHEAGSSGRQALQAEWDQVKQWLVPTSGISNPIFADLSGTQDLGGHNLGLDLSGMDSWLGGGLWAATGSFADQVNAATPVAIWTFDLANASTAQLDQVASTISVWKGGRWRDAVASDQNRADRLSKANSLDQDRTLAAIATLTNADLGKASTARANAETRQQLALSTVRQAISAYGNYANGLLGNVARTQRGVMA